MSADRDRGIRRQKQKRAKDRKKALKRETQPVGKEISAAAAPAA